MTDDKILALLTQDERRGFEALVRQYAPYISVIVSSRLRFLDKDGREDAVSDIFLELLEALRKEKYKVDSLKAFVSVIAVRCCIGRYRQHTARGESLPLDALPEQPVTESRYDRAELIAVLKSLGEPDCEIFLRRYFLGQTSAEIAEALGLKPNTVDQIISRGLKKLREQIAR